MIRFLRYVLASLALFGASQHAYADPVGWLYKFSYDCNTLPAVNEGYGNSNMRSVCQSYGASNPITFTFVLSDSVKGNTFLGEYVTWNGSILSFASSIPGAALSSVYIAEQNIVGGQPPSVYPSDEVMTDPSNAYFYFTFAGGTIESKYFGETLTNFTSPTGTAGAAFGPPLPTKVPAPTTAILLMVGLFGLSKCNDPAKPAQLRPLKQMPQRVSSCRAPGEGAGCCKSRSSPRSRGWRAAGFQTGAGERTVLSAF